MGLLPQSRAPFWTATDKSSVIHRNVAFGSKNGPRNGHLGCPLYLDKPTRQLDRSRPKSATSGLMHRSKQQLYSITSSATANKLTGNSSPSDFAVVRLSTSSNLVCW